MRSRWAGQVTFLGAKGGVGSSTVAHNCAWGISNLFSTEVILTDLDLAFGTTNINFDQDPPQGIAEAVFSPERLDDVFLDRTYDFSSNTFEPVLEIVQGSAPVTVLDLPHIWASWSQAVLKEVDDVVVTATPNLANLRNTKNLIDTLTKMWPNDKAPRLVLNQVGMPKRPEISFTEFLRTAGDRTDGHHSLRRAAFRRGLQQRPDDRRNRRQVADRRNLFAAGHVLTGRAEVKNKKKSGLSGLRSLLGRK